MQLPTVLKIPLLNADRVHVRIDVNALKMASVHESLYFNPMMTNGVVHANVFGIKDWVTPYKISVLALLYEMTASKITLPERRRLNKLILPLQQVGFYECRKLKLP